MSTLITLAVCAVSFGWAALWTKTYTPRGTAGYVRHTALFTAISALIICAFVGGVFSPVDETYSLANISALGLLIPLCVPIFCVACLYAAGETLFRLLDLRKPKNSENDNSKN